MSPRRRNYGFERRQKDVARRSRQEAKRERKVERAKQGEAGPEMGEPEPTLPSDRWEWFSPSRGRVVATATGQRPGEEGTDDWVLLTESDKSPDTGSRETEGPDADEPEDEQPPSS